MKVLNPDEFVTMEIDSAATLKFEEFLDRNFPRWRGTQIGHYKGIRRAWILAEITDRPIRHAIYRRDYVELYDEFDDPNQWADDVGPLIIHMRRRVCDIEGNADSVAVWGAHRSVKH